MLLLKNFFDRESASTLLERGDEMGEQFFAVGRSSDFDIAIVGAGIAGCYAGYRLLTSQFNGTKRFLGNGSGAEPMKVCLLESSGEIGGRMKSELLCDYHADLGAMRFSKRSSLLSDLIGHLGLTGAVDIFHREKAENLFFARGKRFRRNQLSTGDLPYELHGGETGKTPSGLVAQAIDQVIPGFSMLKRLHDRLQADGEISRARAIEDRYRALANSAAVNGAPLGDLSWFGFLSLTLSQEAIRFIEDFEGYECRESNGSALHWMDNVFYAPDGAGEVRISTGAATIPVALAERFAQCGGQIRVDAKVERIRRDAGSYLLQVANQVGRETIHARCVILATQRTALTQIDMPFLKQLQFMYNDDHVKSIDAFKLFLIYPYAWWNGLGIVGGVSTTDLPIRQVYYYPPGSDGALMLASYCCGRDVDYWSRLLDTPFSDSLNDFRGLELSVGKWRIAQEAHMQIAKMHGYPSIPAPVDAHLQFWRSSEGREGWHVWQPRTKPVATIQRVGRPSRADSVFIVGEAWSLKPGSVEGSLQSVENALQGGLGLRGHNWSSAPNTNLF